MDKAQDHINLGTAFFAFQALRGRDVEFKKALELSPADGEILFQLGQLATNVGNYGEAKKIIGNPRGQSDEFERPLQIRVITGCPGEISEAVVEFQKIH